MSSAKRSSAQVRVRTETRPTIAKQRKLSARERQIIRLVARGLVNKEIARALSITLETVRTHLKRIYEKLNVHSRTEAAMRVFAK